jgi:transcriptional regulator with XRE-family HTH domain
MWLDNIKELKKSLNLSSKQLAERSNLPEKTISRLLSGDTKNPYIDTLTRIANALGCTLNDILADSKAVVGTETLVELQENVEVVNTEKDLLLAENKILKDKVAVLTSELELTKMKLMHKEELLAVHNYYTKLKSE